MLRIATINVDAQNAAQEVGEVLPIAKLRRVSRYFQGRGDRLAIGSRRRQEDVHIVPTTAIAQRNVQEAIGAKLNLAGIVVKFRLIDP